MLACCWFGSGFTFLRQFMSLLAEISHPQQVNFVIIFCPGSALRSWECALVGSSRSSHPEA